MDTTKERAAQLLDDLKTAARRGADTPEPSDEERLQRAADHLRHMPDADVSALVQTYPAFRVLMNALATHHVGRSVADLDGAATRFAADVAAAPRGPEAAAVLWISRTLRAPTRCATLAEIDRWVDCLAAMPNADMLAFVRDHPALRGPVLERAIRRMRARIYDSSLPGSVRAEAAALFVQLGIDRGPRVVH